MRKRFTPLNPSSRSSGAERPATQSESLQDGQPDVILGPLTLRPAGNYALLKGTECRAVRDGGWKLTSRDAASRKDGFQPAGRGLYERRIGTDERLEVISLRYEGTYQGIPVQITQNLKGSLVLTTGDPRAKELGFDPIERSDWVLVVEPDARGLVVTPRRTKVSAPWLHEKRKREGDR